MFLAKVIDGLTKLKSLFFSSQKDQALSSSGKEPLVYTSYDEALSYREWEKLFNRSSFSRYLPYVAYDRESKFYFLRDGYVGFILECIPYLFISPKEAQAFKNLLLSEFPDRTVVQFLLISSPWLDEFFLIPYLNDKKRYAETEFFRFYEHYTEFLRNKVWHGSPPVRHFRMFVCIKIPYNKISKAALEDKFRSVFEIFRSVMLNPRVIEASEFLFLMRRLFGQEIPAEILSSWCPNVELSRQIILSDTEVTVDYNRKCLKTGNFYWKIFTPKLMPPEIDWDFTSFITGSYAGPSGDILQISTPFIISLNIIIEDLSKEIESKANIYLYQNAFGSFIIDLKQKQEEHVWAISESRKGERFFRYIYSVCVFGKDLEQVENSVKQARQLWELRGVVTQEENIILLPLFIMSLPFGFYYNKRMFHLLRREFVGHTDLLSYLVPVQTDFMGTGDPVLLFSGRKGQIIGIDIFSHRSTNYNFFIAAPTGKGKSFLMNYIVFNYLGRGNRVRIVDIGRSYKKLADIMEGIYIEFTKESDFSLNPFAYVEGNDEDIALIVEILSYMIISSTEKLDYASVLPESALNLLTAATRWAVNKAKTYNRVATIDDVYHYLVHFPELVEDFKVICPDENDECSLEFKKIAKHLAFNLQKYVSEGIYGKWFSGDNILNIRDYPFVILELEELKSMPDLFRVVSLLVLNFVTADLYLSKDRSTQTLIIVDEAWQFLQGNESYKRVIEEGYRRARKYYGSFSIITQSILDLLNFGPVGQVILSNSAFKFFLESGDFIKAIKEGLLPFREDDVFVQHLLSSVKSNPPLYSEIFILTDTFGYGVARLIVDRFLYYLFTTNPRDISRLYEKMKEKGGKLYEAIEEIIKEDTAGK